MNNTTKSNESIAQEEKLKGIPFAEVADLRDYFAAKAMQGDLSFGAIAPEAGDETINLFANHYYRIADAMLKTRNQ